MTAPLTSNCRRCRETLVMAQIGNDIGPKWMHSTGVKDHDPDSDDELTTLANAILFDLTRVQLNLLSGVQASIVDTLWMGRLRAKLEKFGELATEHPMAFVPAATPPDISDMEARIYLMGGAIPPAAP